MDTQQLRKEVMDRVSDRFAGKIENIARVCHEANRAWCEANGDFSQKPWEQAEVWQTLSAMNGVVFKLTNPDAPESAQHESWMEGMIHCGWVYGPVKDADKKTHPCIVPYEELPEVDRKKDALFAAIVNALK